MVLKVLFLSACVIGLAGCMTPSAETSTTASTDEAAPQQKQSLEALTDEYDKVTLVDDETGEEKLVCKYIKRTGTRFGQKVCATPKEWDAMRRESQDETNRTQRNLDARCPGGC